MNGYVSDCRRILYEIGNAERKAAGEYVSPKGEILMTTPVAFGRRHALPVVTAFLATYPDIDVRMMMSDRNTHLLDEHIDLAVRIGRLPDSSLRATQVGTVSQVICGSARYFARHGVPQTLHDLTRLSCITFDSLSPTSSWLFADTDGKEQAVTVRSRLAVSTAEAAVDAAISGLGVTRVLSYQAMEAVKEGKLQVVLAAFQSNPVPVSLLYAYHDPLPLKIRSFLDFAVPRLREHAAMGGWDF
ncbi:LysR substrate-binding domain-containing protein [Acetobacter orientalis]|nr:LysR substrate-binding domain-containing protein [Acetobacter orientalis]